MSNIDTGEQRRGPGRPRKDGSDRIVDRERPERMLRDGNVSVDDHGRLAIEGRDGQMLSRRRPGSGSKDVLYIPPEVIPTGWDYQWNVYTVFNEPAVSQQLAMAENGWRPVPAERHDGMFMPAGYKGPIIRDGLILDERPLALTEEARREDYRAAVTQMSDQNRELGLRDKLPRGFSDARDRYRGAGAQVKTNIDPGHDIPRPQYEVASGEQ